MRAPTALRPSARCGTVAGALPRYLDGSERVGRRVERHVQTCLRCQAEVAQYRRLLRALRALRTQDPRPPAGLAGRVLAQVETAAERRAVRSALRRRRAAYLAGLGVAGAAAGLAGVVVAIAGRARGGARPVLFAP